MHRLSRIQAKVLLFSLILVLPWVASAQQDDVQQELRRQLEKSINDRSRPLDLRALAWAIPERLTADCLSRAGNLDLKKLKEQFRQIRDVVLPLFPAGIEGGRGGEIYLPGSKQVFYFPPAFNQVPEAVREVYALHASLGASSYDDINYELSIGLWWYSKLSREERNGPRGAAAFRVLLGKLDLAEGGKSYTGGGGDPYAIDAKMKLMERASSWLEKEGSRIPEKQRPSLEELHYRILKLKTSTDASISAPPSGIEKLQDGTLSFKVGAMNWIQAVGSEDETKTIDSALERIAKDWR